MASNGEPLNYCAIGDVYVRKLKLHPPGAEETTQSLRTQTSVHKTLAVIRMCALRLDTLEVLVE